MPALPNVADVLRVDLAHTWDEDPHLTSRLYVKYSGSAPSTSDLNGYATTIAAQWEAFLSALAADPVSLVNITVTDLTSPTANIGTWTGSASGVRTGNTMGINTCTNLGFQITRRYRGGKPKMFAPWGVTEDLAHPNQWNSTFINSANTKWGQFHDGILSTFGSTTTTDQVNVSYYHGFASTQNPVTMRWRNIPTPRPAAVVDVITSHAVSPLVSSQRRRVRVT